MTVMNAHYPTILAKRADFIIHLVGITLALFGGGILLGLAISYGFGGKIAAASVYAIGLVAMLSFSLAYNFSKPNLQPILRRFDHAGIFLMIAASYTPFTTQVLHGTWSIVMTSVVWSLAVIGMAGKLFLPGLGKAIWVFFYLALGWAAVIAVGPMLKNMSLAAVILLAIGGVVYSVGTIFYVSKSLKYRRAIWHGHVITAAIVHYVAILVGVFLNN